MGSNVIHPFLDVSSGTSTPKAFGLFKDSGFFSRAGHSLSSSRDRSRVRIQQSMDVAAPSFTGEISVYGVTYQSGVKSLSEN